jgi:hypothetical protein
MTANAGIKSNEKFVWSPKNLNGRRFNEDFSEAARGPAAWRTGMIITRRVGGLGQGIGCPD